MTTSKAMLLGSVTKIDKTKLQLVFFWYGIKTHTLKQKGLDQEKWHFLPDADLYIDCRVIKERGVAGATGLAQEFQAGIQKYSGDQIRRITETIIEGVNLLPDRRDLSDDACYKRPFVVCFFCAFGMHRSPSTCMVVADRLLKQGYNVTTPKNTGRFGVSAKVAGLGGI